MDVLPPITPASFSRARLTRPIEAQREGSSVHRSEPFRMPGLRTMN